ncbi:exported hypothetical protein [uncultured Alphaproteobacteria bacterium]|jgi:hypothetical protein|uniref:Uncharacterized protein n=1 Tax=uncultured Alphaproteobacteria bacterium TaxID=91750 RepID=A0A212KKZ3_9PROT|nr:exported hypothetical protein [uncultured Alphaproteobacteria bacterium]
MRWIGNWISGGIGAALGLLGLFISAHARDDYVYAVGLIVAIACALFVMNMIKNAFDEAERR